jgi:hypothetical protein
MADNSQPQPQPQPKQITLYQLYRKLQENQKQLKSENMQLTHENMRLKAENNLLLSLIESWMKRFEIKN